MDYQYSSTKRVPKNLKECMQIDEVSEHLWTWAERIDKIGKIFSILSAAVFIIAGIAMFPIYAILVLLLSPVVFFISYAGFFAVALILSALASITQNTCVSANVALLQASTDFDIQTEEPAHSAESQPAANNSAPMPSTWYCTECGTPNSTNYSQCKKCGRYKH